MKILLVTNMFPTDARPNYGVFVKEQMEAVAHRFPQVEYDLYNIDNIHGNQAYLKSIFEINRKIRRGNYDLIHIHYGLSGLFLLAPFRPCKVPVVMTLHGGDIQPEQGKNVQVALTRRALKRADVAISLNDRMTALASEKCPIVVKIPCSVNTDIFTPPEQDRPLLSNQRELRIIFPSDRDRTVKNYPLFKAVIARLEEKYGVKVQKQELKNMNRHEVAAALRSADLLLMTSISEGSPQVVKEAMACNLPVISTKVGDVDTLLHGVRCSGWSETPDCEALADRVYAAVSGRPTGMSGREKIFRLGLDNDSVALQVYNVYLSLLKQ